MADQLQFRSWQQSSLYDGAQESGARITGHLNLTLTDTLSANPPATGTTSFAFLTAADIASIAPEEIRHMAPAPFVRDAEVTKHVHIDFNHPDYPWRFTSRLRVGEKVVPWLTLLVGTATEIEVTGSVATVADEVLKEYLLEQESYLWAHSQFSAGVELSRLMAPRELPPESECVAVLVPSFNKDGGFCWSVNNGLVTRTFGTTDGTLTALHSWRFWTAEGGDFETLAEALRVPKAGLAGVSDLHYRRDPEGGTDPVDEVLQIRGAITSMQGPPAQVEAIAKVRTDLDLLNEDLSELDAIGLPQYGSPWLPKPDDIPTGWPHELNDDPRNRGIAGLGVWMGVEAQEALIDAAVSQAGALDEASQQINHLALGLESAGRLWDRRMWKNRKQRFRLLGPMMARMNATGGGNALERVTSGTSPFPPAFFTGAAQRLMRGRSAQSRHVVGGSGGFDITTAVTWVNQADKAPERRPKGVPHAGTVAENLGKPPIEDVLHIDEEALIRLRQELAQILQEAIVPFRAFRAEMEATGQEQFIPPERRSRAIELRHRFVGRFEQFANELGFDCSLHGFFERMMTNFAPSPHPLPAGADSMVHFMEWVFERVLEDDCTANRILEGVEAEMRACMAGSACSELHRAGVEIRCEDIIVLSPPRPPSKRGQIDTDGITDAIVEMVDPRGPNPPARVRVCSRLEGIDCGKLAPPEFPIGIDFPTWDLLRQYEKEWLLPGARSLASDSVTALQTNPAFIDAYMFGINSQFMSEMRWRKLAVDRRCTPLRMFWGQVDFGRHRRSADIDPFLEWTKATGEPLGALSHQTIKPDDAGNTSGERLVIVFRTSLFRRYPRTLVYLVKPPQGASETQVDDLLKATPELSKPDTFGDTDADIDAWRKQRKFFGPVFSGAITPDLTFFTFDVKPGELGAYWLVLDEPPAELRFRLSDVGSTVKAADYAAGKIDDPTRVAISGRELLEQGMTP